MDAGVSELFSFINTFISICGSITVISTLLVLFFEIRRGERSHARNYMPSWYMWQDKEEKIGIRVDPEKIKIMVFFNSINILSFLLLEYGKQLYVKSQEAILAGTPSMIPPVVPLVLGLLLSMVNTALFILSMVEVP
jgi:hypothetical protein